MIKNNMDRNIILFFWRKIYYKFIVKKYKIKYNKNILFIKENFVEGGAYYYDQFRTYMDSTSEN